MFNFLPILSVALVSVSSASALVIPRASVVTGDWPVPSSYAQGYLEPYDTYKSRYLTLDCEAQHNTPFFDACCHPLLATQSLQADRAPECNPANQPTSTASAAQPTSTDSDDDECDPDDEESDPTDGDDGDCEDETSSAIHESTSAPVHTSSVHSSAPTPAPTPISSAHSSAVTEAHSSAAPAPVNVAPVPSIASSAPAPSSSKVHTSSPAPAKPSSSAAAPAPAPTSEVFTDGVATFFYQGGNAGACGETHADSDVVAAIDISRYGNTEVKSSLCGKKVQITNQNNGKTVVVPIEDACPGCKNSDSIDLSVGAFTQIATEAEGEVPISWFFV